MAGRAVLFIRRNRSALCSGLAWGHFCAFHFAADANNRIDPLVFSLGNRYDFAFDVNFSAKVLIFVSFFGGEETFEHFVRLILFLHKLEVKDAHIPQKHIVFGVFVEKLQVNLLGLLKFARAAQRYCKVKFRFLVVRIEFNYILKRFQGFGIVVI